MENKGINENAKDGDSVNGIIQWFSPRWFISVMGTAALANIYQLLSKGQPGFFHTAAVFFLMLALIAYPVFLVLMAARFVKAWDLIKKEWRHANLIQFYSAISIAAALCAAGLVNIPLGFVSEAFVKASAWLFWWVSCLTGVFFIFLTPYQVIVGSHAEPKRVLGFWFLPPVGLYVLVFSGNFLMMHAANPAMTGAMLLFNALLLGLASVLTGVIYALFLGRILLYPFPKKDVAPNFMIALAPVGVAIVAFNTFLQLLNGSGSAFFDVKMLSGFIQGGSLLLWGFGLWWLLMSLGLIITYFVKQGIPVTLGYWAFIFPPAAFTLATLVLAGIPVFSVLKPVAFILAFLLSLAWLAVLVSTLRGVLNKSIFEVSPTFKEELASL